MQTRGKRKELKGEYVKASTDIDRLEIAIKKGGKFEVLNTEYWLEHIEGGRERVTKRIFEKLTK